MKISVVIPVFRSKEALNLLYQRLCVVLEKHAHVFEIILVEDAGLDGSWTIIEQLMKGDPRVKGIQLLRNYGQHNALLCGIRQAKYDTVITLDDDLQNPPEEIPKLINKLNEGYDVVYGYPLKEQHGFLRDCASQLTKLVLQNAMGAETSRHISAFRIFRTCLRDAFANYNAPFVSIDVLLTWGTTRFTAIKVNHEKRTMGSSNYTFSKLMAHALNMVVGFSTVPLQIASVVGFVLTVFGVLILFYVLGRFIFEGQVVPGFVFLASIIAIFSGAQMFALGVMGEYLLRIHSRTMEKPCYVIRKERAV